MIILDVCELSLKRLAGLGSLLFLTLNLPDIKIHYFLVTQMADQSQTSTGLSVYGGVHKVLTLPATVFLAKTNSVMFL